MFGLSLALALLLSPARAACPATSGDVIAQIYTADAAFASMDIESFSRARANAVREVGCLSERLPPNDAAALHRLQALDAYIAKDRERALRSFAVSIRLQPDYTLPTSIAPEGNPLYQRYEQARELLDGEWEPVRLPRSTVLYVDGQASDSRPTDRPAVLQVLTEDGRVIWTGYLPAGEAPPDLASVAKDRGGEPNLVIKQSNVPSIGRPSPLMLGAGGALAASVVSYGVSAWTRSQFNSSDTAFTDLESWRKRTNGAVVVSGAFGAAAVGLGAAAVFTAEF